MKFYINLIFLYSYKIILTFLLREIIYIKIYIFLKYIL